MMNNGLIYLIKKMLYRENLQVAYKAGKDIFGLDRLNFSAKRAKE